MPDVRDIRVELIAVHRWMRQHKREDFENGGLKVRLQVMPKSVVLPESVWCLHSGDPQYDTDHSGYWGYGSLAYHATEEDITAVAKELLDGVDDDRCS